MYIYLDSILNRSQIGVKSELSRSYVCSSCVKKKKKCAFKLYSMNAHFNFMNLCYK